MSNLAVDEMPTKIFKICYNMLGFKVQQYIAIAEFPERKHMISRHFITLSPFSVKSLFVASVSNEWSFIAFKLLFAFPAVCLAVQLCNHFITIPYKNVFCSISTLLHL